MLSAGLASPELADGPWRVAHTKARNEKALAFDLAARGIAYFLPLLERVVVSGGRKRRVLHPLFPSYVFFSGGEQERYAAMTTNRICRAIETPEQGRLVSELSSLSKALSSKAILHLYPHVAVGQPCRITGGPFEGFEGVVVSARAETAKLVLQVSMLGQGAAMEIDVSLVEPVLDVPAAAPKRGAVDVSEVV
jgi:transcription antitermination factor NusG